MIAMANIVQDTSTGKFHVFLWRDAPMPGPYDPAITFVRLRSVGHMPGTDTREASVQVLQEMRVDKISIPESGVWIGPEDDLGADLSQSPALTHTVAKEKLYPKSASL